jgi:quercetin dioxygenase-like cupin family protein
MRRIAIAAAVLVLVVIPARAQSPSAEEHIAVTPAMLKWGPAPPSLPSGAQMAVVQGDPTKEGPFVIRAKFPAGYKVPPHWHPTAEHITVLSGAFQVGMGDKMNVAEMKTFPPGSFVALPKEMHHYGRAKVATTIQIHGVGPFALTYVNPSDDPRTNKPTQ